MNAREEILAGIRAAIGPQPQPVEISRRYTQTGTLSPAQCVHLFIDRIQDYGAAVHHASPGGIASEIARALRSTGKQRIGVPSGFPQAWLPLGLDLIEDAALTYRELDSLDAVITLCSIAIAVPGAVVLQHGAGQGRRAFTLIPDRHLCVVRTEQIVETVPAAFRLLAPALPTTTISGPSATSDIEMTRIEGVHGPRTLEIVLVA